MLEKRRLLTKLQAEPAPKATVAVPGLAELLEQAVLARCQAAAEAWCVGRAQSLAQLAEQVEGLCEELRLKPIEEKRLRKLLQATLKAVWKGNAARSMRRMRWQVGIWGQGSRS